MSEESVVSRGATRGIEKPRPRKVCSLKFREQQSSSKGKRKNLTASGRTSKVDGVADTKFLSCPGMGFARSRDSYIREASVAHLYAAVGI